MHLSNVISTFFTTEPEIVNGCSLSTFFCGKTCSAAGYSLSFTVFPISDFFTFEKAGILVNPIINTAIKIFLYIVVIVLLFTEFVCGKNF